MLAEPGLTGEALDAAAEACWLALARHAATTFKTPPPGTVAHVFPGAATLSDEVRWLRQVAAAAKSPDVRAVATQIISDDTR